MLKVAVFMAAAPAALVVAVIVLARAVAIVPSMLLVRRLDRPEAYPPCQAVRQSAAR